MALVETIIVFLVSLLIGALGIYIGGMIIADTEDFSHAIITALIGAIALWIGSLIPIPFIGLLLALLAWIWVINWRYPGGWMDAILIAIIAWVTVVVVLYLLDLVGLGTFDAIGVPS